MASLSNFVRARLSQAINSDSTSITVFYATSSYYIAPLNPSGAVYTLKIVDSIDNPQSAEIITYTGLVNNGSGSYTLNGVVRGVSGTSAKKWRYGSFVESIADANTINNFIELNEPNFADLIQAQTNITSDYASWLVPVVHGAYTDTVDYITTPNLKTYILTGLAISDVSGLTTALSNKQDTLASGINIQTINGNNILTSGNLTVASSGDLSESVGNIVLYLESIGLINLVVDGNGEYMTDSKGNYIHTTFTKNIVTTG
jgi:hypothetical protein